MVMQCRLGLPQITGELFDPPASSGHMNSAQTVLTVDSSIHVTAELKALLPLAESVLLQ